MRTFLLTTFIVLFAVLPLWAQDEPPEGDPEPELTVAQAAPPAEPVAKPKLVAKPEFPIRGETSLAELSGVADPTQWQVTFTYRPNSKTEEITQAVAFPADGKLRWKAVDSGIVQINAKGPGDKDKLSINVAVRFPSPPISGIIILLIAGFILFGGAGWSLAKALNRH